MTVQRNVGLTAMAVCVVFAATDARAQQFMPTGRDTLRGLPGVEVVVEPLTADLARDGLSAAALKTSVEGVLRSNGVPMYATQAANPSPAKPYVYVQVTGLALPREGHVLSLQVQLRQTLRSLVTGSAIVNAMTWDQQTVVFLPAGGGMQAVHGEVQSLIDEFVQDWGRVH